MLNEKQAREVVGKVLSHSRADQSVVEVQGGRRAHLRFARNAPSTSGVSSDHRVTVTSSFGTRSGTVTVNQLDDQTLARAVRRAEEMARLAPEDPEFMPALSPQRYPRVDAWSEETATRGQSAMASGVAAAIAAARRPELVAAGFARTAAGFEAVGNSAGLFAYHRSTSGSFSTTVGTPDGSGSGWAGRAAHSVDRIDFAGAASIAVNKALASRAPRPLAPGVYPAILEPACVADMLELLLGGMDQRRADEGRSYFSKARGGTRLGEALFAPTIDIRSDPADSRCAARPWDGEGLPHAPRPWIDRGVVAALTCNRFWASRQRRAPVPAAPNMIMAGGTGTLADLIRSTRRAVLVTSMWYIRSLDPQSLLYTGLTRDGVFWIENGAIAHPVNNFRWNESPVAMLKKVEAMSAAEALPSRGEERPRSVVPALRVSGFTFASVSDAV